MDISQIRNFYKLKKYILLFPFCSPHLTVKKWPYYNKLIELILNRYGEEYKIVIAPGPTEIKDAEDINANMKLLSSSLEPMNITSITSWTASNAQSQSFFRFDIEPYDVYFVEGVLVHN